MRRAVLFLLLMLSWPAAAQSDATKQSDVWASARADGVVILMRHAIAPGTGDPAGFTLGDCSTQRNLNDQGRTQARRIGAAIRAADIKIDLVLTSAWCRAAETTELLGLGTVTVEPALNSFFDGRADSDRATAELRARLKTLNGRKAVLVTHQVNITALTGVYPASGEMIFIAIEPVGEVSVRGRLALP